ncbi:hypothetical protein F2Q68_00035451 [Brassica cretica]|uniref:ferredoxin--NADP(+) reductase n=2 Tax=Brassica cretica TaxID=69181 RepID=A0A8S9H8L5_BRACR|nr:hypothetical protein F2Q68_00035451 [Brassica cretica]KAF3590939.1 hypothetical protein DY000_02023925 [Brassica cretica]
MASTLNAAVSLTSSKSSSLPATSCAIAPDRIRFAKGAFYYKSNNVVTSRRVVSVRAEVTTTDTPPVKKVEKESKKNEEGVITNKYRPKEPYTGKVLLNTKITADDAPGETWHMVFSHQGEIPYREGQSVGVIADGIDKNGKPHKVRLYSIASSALGDLGNSETVSLCVKRLVYTNDAGEVVKGVCSNFLCDLKPGSDVKLTGPVGKEMLMPKDPNATVIMVWTEKKPNLIFVVVINYLQEFDKMKAKAPENFRVDYAISREQANDKGEKMYIQTRMAQYAPELWELLKKDNTFVYMCGLKGMEKGIDDIMVSLAANDGIDWFDYKKQLKKAEQWNVEVY